MRRISGPGPMAILCTTALCLTGPRGAAGETLDEALSAAYASNPTLLAAQAELRRIDELVPQALAGWRPQADLDVGGGYVEGDSNEDNLSSRSGGTGLVELRVRQPLYNYATSYNVSEAEDTVRAQRAHLKAVESDVLLQAVSAYADVAYAQTVLESMTDHQRISQRDLDSAHRRQKQGELSDTDVSQAEASAASAVARQAQAEADLSSAREAYELVIGHAPGTAAMPQPPADLPATRDDVLAAMTANPNVVAAEFSERAARNGVDVRLGDKIPQVFLEGRAHPDLATALVIVSVPLYHGTTDSQVREAKELVAQRRLELEAQRRDQQRTAMNAWYAFTAAKANIAAYESQLKAATRAVEGIRREEGAGLRTLSDVMTAQQQVIDTDVSLLAARRDALVQAVRILAAIGRLNAENLQLSVTPYDVDAHYRSVRNKWWGLGPKID
jgi:outer membrane protein